VYRPKHVQQLINIGKINSTTLLHLIGFLYEIYITMHGSMNIGETYLRFSSYAEYTSTIFLQKWPNLYQDTGIISQTPVNLN